MRLTSGNRLKENSQEAAARRSTRTNSGSAPYEVERGAESIYEEGDGYNAISPQTEVTVFPQTQPTISNLEKQEFDVATVAEMPGLSTSREIAAERAHLAGLVRRRLRVWIVALGALSVITCVLIGVYINAYGYGFRGHAPPWSPWFYAAITVIAVAVAIAVAAIGGITIGLASFINRFDRILDPSYLDETLSESIRGDDKSSWYVTRRQIVNELSKRQNSPGPLVRIFLPPECSTRALLALATEVALRRWYELGLIQVSPLIVGTEIRFRFIGRRLIA